MVHDCDKNWVGFEFASKEFTYDDGDFYSESFPICPWCREFWDKGTKNEAKKAVSNYGDCGYGCVVSEAHKRIDALKVKE